MALSIKPKFTKTQLQDIMQKRKDNLGNAIFFRLQRIGEAFVTNARTNGNYKDHTGNLRSSIGYVILKDGVQMAGNLKTFPPADRKPKKLVRHTGLQEDSGQTQSADVGLVEDKAAPAIPLNGQQKAKEVIDEVAGRYPQGYVLIVVAGMEYAAAVESRNYDVITGSSLIADQQLKEAIETLQTKVNAL